MNIRIPIVEKTPDRAGRRIASAAAIGRSIPE
jgi:hypothetical protein